MAPADIEVLLVRSPAAGVVETVSLGLPAASTVAHALSVAGWDCVGHTCGIWGRKVSLTEALRAGDRVEVYRALTGDPMQARHRRHALQGRRVVSRHRPPPG